MNVLGIDPGISGALALLDNTGKILDIADVPTLILKVIKGKAKKSVNYKSLQMLLYGWHAEHGEMEAYIEDVHSMPGQSAPSMFNMGATFGAIKAILTCEDIPITYVSPQTWKKYFKIPMGGDLKSSEKKELSRSHAIRLYPCNIDWLARKADHNRAEAVLIARYGVKLWQQPLKT